MTTLSGLRALVTGGGSGIGFETTRLLVESGAEVVVVDNSFEAAERLNELSGDVKLLLGDVRDLDVVAEAVKMAAGPDGILDMVFGNAGVPCPDGISDLTAERWMNTLSINVVALGMLAQVARPALAKSDSPSIVFTASVAGLVALGAQPAYAASKGAVVALTRALAAEFADERIRVNSICPGWVQTPMLQRFYEDLHSNTVEREVALNEAQKALPFGRFAQPSEIAQAAYFLLTPPASYITGVSLAVDGGLSAIR